MWHAEGLLLKKRFEYRLETIQLLNAQADEEAFVACLNEWGKEGWFICQIDLTALHVAQPQALKVLLVRNSEPICTELNILNDDDDDFEDD